MKLTVPVVPEQIVFAVTLAVGKAFTVIVTLPLAVLLQTGVVALATLTKLYVEFAVNTGVVTLAFPVASNKIVWFAPESTV